MNRHGRAEALKKQAYATVRPGIVKVFESGCGERAAEAGVVRLPASVFALAHEQALHNMRGPTFPRSRALVEVARVLVQERRKHGAFEHDVRGAVGIVRCES